MKVVIDIEANGLINPTEIWLVVCKDIDTGEYHIFRNLTSNVTERNRFFEFSRTVEQWIGHNLLSYDWPALMDLIGCLPLDVESQAIDTLIISKLIDYPRKGHSVEDYGDEFGIEKGTFFKFTDPHLYNPSTDLFKLLETYCIRDVDITHKIYLKYLKYISKPEHKASILLEHQFQLIVNSLHENGFSFNVKKAEELLLKVQKELDILDAAILKEFPPREVLIREFTPRATKFGTISKTSVPRALHDKISEYEVDKTYAHTKLEEFNPASHKQVIDVLWEAGWSPVDKTQTHIDTERELQKLKYSKNRDASVDTRIAECYTKLKNLERYGWQVKEPNLLTLPNSAPSSARTLAQRILYEARRRTLTEWLGLVRPETGRIHGKFYGLGAWPHRMAHQAPNTANIPGEFDTEGKKKLLGKELRSLWQAPKNRLLVGVDAEGIQLRIFAHYINDPEFIDALVRGKKDDKTDPHSLNQRVLGSVCKTRAAAKRFIYALLLGAGMGKLAQILNCSVPQAEEALDRLLERYSGFAYLKAEVIPYDAKRGFFIGLDGRKVRIPGDTLGTRKHLAMSGYLQNGEQTVIKRAAIKFTPALLPGELLVNIVHDEYVIEIKNDVMRGKELIGIVSQALVDVGTELNLKCPLAGAGGVGLNWLEIH